MAEALFKDIHEIGLAVKDARATADFLARVFQTEASSLVTDDSPGVEASFATVKVGDQWIGVMEDVTGKGPVARFIERRGEGIFSILVEVRDIKEAMDHMRSLGVQFVEDEPRILRDTDYGGRHYSELLLAWTHPRSTHGLLVEIQELRP